MWLSTKATSDGELYYSYKQRPQQIKARRACVTQGFWFDGTDTVFPLAELNSRFELRINFGDNIMRFVSIPSNP
jgi:hypothetical protein